METCKPRLRADAIAPLRENHSGMETLIEIFCYLFVLLLRENHSGMETPLNPILYQVEDNVA